MSNLESGTFPHAASKFPSEKTTDCNNDLVLQGINNLQKDLGEVKGDIKSIKTDVSDTKGDIKVINNRLEVLDKTVGKNSDGINALSNKAYLIYAYFNSFFHKPFHAIKIFGYRCYRTIQSFRLYIQEDHIVIRFIDQIDDDSLTHRACTNQGDATNLINSLDSRRDRFITE